MYELEKFVKRRISQLNLETAVGLAWECVYWVR